MTLAEFGAAVRALLPDGTRFSVSASLQLWSGYQTVQVYLHEGGAGFDRHIGVNNLDTRSADDDLYTAVLVAIEGGAWTRTEAPSKPVEPQAVGL